MTLLFPLQALGIFLSIALLVLLACAGWMAIRFRGAQRRRWLLRVLFGFGAWLLGVAAYYGLIFFVYLPGLRPSPVARPGTIVLVGQRAPEFSLTTPEGVAIGPEQLRGRVVVMNFFATWCGPCLMELPGLERIWREHHGDTNFALLCVGREESDQSINAFRKKYAFALLALHGFAPLYAVLLLTTYDDTKGDDNFHVICITEKKGLKAGVTSKYVYCNIRKDGLYYADLSIFEHVWHSRYI